MNTIASDGLDEQLFLEGIEEHAREANALFGRAIAHLEVKGQIKIVNGKNTDGTKSVSVDTSEWRESI